MIDLTLTLAVIAVFCCALFGWGRIVRWLTAGGTDRGTPPSWTVTMILGLALLIAIGGVLNLVRLANIWALSGLIALGLGLCVAPWIRRAVDSGLPAPHMPARTVIAARASLFALALVALIFTIATQLPPELYNFGDDLQKYFAHPVRMLDTGTLFGSPLSAMGSESLGGMSFLHGFIVAYFPLTYLNGVDSVFGLFLCLLLIAGFAWQRPALAPAALVAMAALYAISPQYVNISALYMGSALILTAIFVTADPDEAGTPPSPLALGLIYAALIALKPTFLIFAGLHGLFMIVAVTRTAGGARAGLIWGATLTGWSLLCLAPWIALHGPHFVTALNDPVAGNEDKAPVVIGLIDLLSTRKLFYGASLAHYSVTVILVALALIAAWRPFGKRNDPMRSSAAATVAMALACATGYLLVLLVAGPLLAGYGTALRYFVPVIIATLPAAMCLAALHLGNNGATGRVLGVLPIIAGLIVAGAFIPSLSARVDQAMTKGSIHAFTKLATSERYLQDNRRVLSPDMRQRIRAIQARVPKGEPIVAWINAPFTLDYARNPIIDVDIAGLTTPWARIGGPRIGGPRIGGARLGGVRYAIWEYRGYGVRTPRQYARQARGQGFHQRAMALRSFPLARYLQGQSQSAELLHNDGTIALFRTTAPMSWP